MKNSLSDLNNHLFAQLFACQKNRWQAKSLKMK